MHHGRAGVESVLGRKLGPIRRGGGGTPKSVNKLMRGLDTAFSFFLVGLSQSGVGRQSMIDHMWCCLGPTILSQLGG
jgi:hypothetical protein